MSLADLRKLNENAVTFRSHVDGSYHELTPERAIESQRRLDSDIAMVLDECTAFPATEDAAHSSMQLSMRWAARCREEFQRTQAEKGPGYGLFGIVQGGVFVEFRKASAKALLDIGFDGYAIGGLAVGEGQEMMFGVVEATLPHLPVDRPRYLMGVGKPDDIVGAVVRGVDMFDCVLPTRSGRTGQAFTRHGTVNLRNARHKDDPRQLDPNCACPTCTQFSRAYLHHLVRSGEMLGPIALTRHNLTYYQDLMAGLREAIEAGDLASFVEDFRRLQCEGDLPEVEI